MSITPEICTHCGQAIGSSENFYALWKKFLVLKYALLRCHSSLNIFEVKTISGNAIKEVQDEPTP